MTLPLEVNFCNMPREPTLEAAAQEEVRSLESNHCLVSCRVSVTRSKAKYDIRIVALTGPSMFCAHCDTPLAATTALHRAFAQIRSKLD